MKKCVCAVLSTLLLSFFFSPVQAQSTSKYVFILDTPPDSHFSSSCVRETTHRINKSDCSFDEKAHQLSCNLLKKKSRVLIELKPNPSNIVIVRQIGGDDQFKLVQGELSFRLNDCEPPDGNYHCALSKKQR